MTTENNMNNTDIGEFQGTETNFATEYMEARKLMGTKGTDLTELRYNVGLLYVNTPEKWAKAYEALIYEIDLRQELLSRV